MRVDYTSAHSVLTGSPATRREPTTERAIGCLRCGGTGTEIVAGPVDKACSSCHGSGDQRCFDCGSPATVADLYAPDGDGPACEGCAIRCWRGCGKIATRIAPVADKRGNLGDEQPLCERCAEEEPERAAKRRRVARLEEDDGRGDWMRARQRDDREVA